MSKNIEMNYFNGSGYEQLYPRTNMNNISDWNSYVYSKSQVDSTVSGINQQISNINNSVSTIENNISSISNTYKITKIGNYVLTRVVSRLFRIADYKEYEFIIIKVLSNVMSNYSYISLGDGITLPVYNIDYNVVFISASFLNSFSNYEVSASLSYSGFVYYDNYEVSGRFIIDIGSMNLVQGSVVAQGSDVGTDIRSTLDFYAVKIA